jgi:5'-methylthioadenosine phosphorylase
VTDNDTWHDGHDSVDAKMVFQTLRDNVEVSQRAVRQLVKSLPSREGCGCHTALDAALVTRPDAISEANRARLGPILERRLAVTA